MRKSPAQRPASSASPPILTGKTQKGSDVKKDYWLQGKTGRGFWIQFFLTELLARALPLEGFWVGPMIEARGDTIDEAETNLLAKLQPHLE